MGDVMGHGGRERNFPTEQKKGMGHHSGGRIGEMESNNTTGGYGLGFVFWYTDRLASDMAWSAL